MTRGYILVARGILGHPLFKPQGPYSRAEAWLWLMEAAAFKDRSVPALAGRKRKMVLIARGELSYSVRYLAQAWRWSTNRVLRFLDELQTDKTIETRTDTGQTVISLCNYETYQAPFHGVETQIETDTDTQSETNKKERKKTKNNKRACAAVVDDYGFADWYALYPRKKQPSDALRAYRRVIDGGKITQSDLGPVFS
jgi:DNA-binding transcriptional MocR family regulator